VIRTENRILKGLKGSCGAYCVLPALAQNVEVDFMKQLLHGGDDAQSVLGWAVGS